MGEPYLLQDGDDRRLPLLQEVQHHQDVGVRRQTSSGRVSDVAALRRHRGRKVRDSILKTTARQSHQ